MVNWGNTYDLKHEVDDMSKPKMVRLDDDAARLLVDMKHELPGNPEFKSLTSEALKQYYEQTYLPMVGGDSASPR